jgi:fluoroquinolone transport system ATP-binding protein
MITAENLAYTYPGAAGPTLKGLDFTVPRGTIHGFLGPSGAGKSTTWKILLGMIRGFSGQVTVCGKGVEQWNHTLYGRIGAAFEVPSFYLKFSALDNLKFFSTLCGGARRDLKGLLALVGLEGEAKKPVGEFSKGMRIRLNLCRALAHDPELLFLDEPTSGLDPANTRNVVEILQKERENGKTIFLTTHNMQTAQLLCDRVAFLADGEIKLYDSPRALQLLYGRNFVAAEFREGTTLRTEEFPLEGLARNARFQELLAAGSVETLHTREASLDDIFIRTTGRSLS